MFHKRKLVVPALSLLAIGVAAATLSVKPVTKAGAASMDTSKWVHSLADISGTAIDGGIKLNGLNTFGKRSYYNQKVRVDGLTFTIGFDGLGNALGDCRGFYLHSGTGLGYFSESTDPSAVFSFWSLYGQMRMYSGKNHDYNGAAAASIGYNSMTAESPTGQSSAGGTLVMAFSTNFSAGISFEKVDTTWYKMTITGDFGGFSSNGTDYNGATDDKSVFSYIKAADLNLDENGDAYLSAFGLDLKGTEDTIKITNMKYKGLEVTAPTKTTYKYGEDLDLTGLVAKVTGSGDDVTVEANQLTVSGYNKNTLGEQTVAVSYDGFSASFKVTVEDYVTGIAIRTQPTKLTYKYNEGLDLTGLVAVKNLASGDSAALTITTDMVSGYSKTTLGEQTVTITSDGFTATFKVTVADYNTSIAMKANPTKVSYKYGEALDVTGGKIEVTTASGAKTEVVLTADMVTEYENNVLGEQTLTVTYQGLTTAFDVTVVDYISSVTLKTAPTKVSFANGEELSVDGALEVTMASGTKKTVNITKDMVSGYDATKAGEQTLTITYEGKTFTYKVTVAEAKSAGCGGSIVATSAVAGVLALAGIAIVASKKKHSK